MRLQRWKRKNSAQKSNRNMVVYMEKMSACIPVYQPGNSFLCRDLMNAKLDFRKSLQEGIPSYICLSTFVQACQHEKSFLQSQMPWVRKIILQVIRRTKVVHERSYQNFSFGLLVKHQLQVVSSKAVFLHIACLQFELVLVENKKITKEHLVCRQGLGQCNCSVCSSETPGVGDTNCVFINSYLNYSQHI